MDAFYASVEQRDDPALRGRPVAVGGRPDQRGVVAAASYEARAFGVRSAMPMARAVRLCPELVIVHPDFERYRQVSRQVMASCARARRWSSRCRSTRPTSTSPRIIGTSRWPRNVAKRLKREIREATDLTASAGVAPNKFLAKIASGYRKPDGLTVIPPERVESFLQDLPVEALWGVGPVTARKLRAAGIEKLVQIRTVDPEQLRASRSAAWRTGCCSFRTATIRGRSCPTARRSPRAPRTPTPRTWSSWRRSAPSSIAWRARTPNG